MVLKLIFPRFSFNILGTSSSNFRVSMTVSFNWILTYCIALSQRHPSNSFFFPDVFYYKISLQILYLPYDDFVNPYSIWCLKKNIGWKFTRGRIFLGDFDLGDFLSIERPYLKNKIFRILDCGRGWQIIWINGCFVSQVKLINSCNYLTKTLLKSVHAEVVCFSQNVRT